MSAVRYARLRFLLLSLSSLISVLLATDSRVQAANGPIAWRTDLGQATAEVARSRQPLLLFFESRSCGPCRRMLLETFADASVAMAVNNGFVPVLVEGDRQPALTARLGVDAFPTVMVVRGDRVEQRLVGFRSPAELQPTLALGTAAAAARGGASSLLRRYAPSVRTRAPQPQPPPGGRPPIPTGPGFHNPFAQAQPGECHFADALTS